MTSTYNISGCCFFILFLHHDINMRGKVDVCPDFTIIIQVLSNKIGLAEFMFGFWLYGVLHEHNVIVLMSVRSYNIISNTHISVVSNVFDMFCVACGLKQNQQIITRNSLFFFKISSSLLLCVYVLHITDTLQ